MTTSALEHQQRTLERIQEKQKLKEELQRELQKERQEYISKLNELKEKMQPMFEVYLESYIKKYFELKIYQSQNSGSLIKKFTFSSNSIHCDGPNLRNNRNLIYSGGCLCLCITNGEFYIDTTRLYEKLKGRTIKGKNPFVKELNKYNDVIDELYLILHKT